MLNHKSTRSARLFWLGALLGAAVFLLVYGLAPLDVANDAFCRGGYIEKDIQQHYAGWLFYRSSAPGWPLGVTQAINAPQGVSVAYTDSIPLLAVLCRPLAAALGGKLVLCLSGNPFAAAATLEQYAIPALLRAAGRREESCIPTRTVCTLTNGFSKPSKGNRYLRATACGGKVTLPGAGNTEAHSSGALSAMMGCNCLVEIPAGSGPVEPGTEVEVLCFVQ